MRLWLKQVAVVARHETPRNLLRGRALPLYLLAGLPVLAVGLLQIVSRVVEEATELQTFAGAAMVYAHIYQSILRLVVYTGCVWIFMNLFRGEVLDRSLHYYFLAPIRREVLVAGKFVSGCVSATLLFVGSTVVSLFLLHAHFGARGFSYLLFGDGARQLWAYVAVSFLGCVGYGAVFLLIGLLMRNPIVPALLIWVLESANAYMPSLLKKISVIFYLSSLLPVRVDEGPFALVAAPVSVWLAVPGLFLFAGAVLVVAGLRVRRMEVNYGAD